jgi:peptidoglycan hydrolase-like protein with peptidoglycan-binding domain
LRRDSEEASEIRYLQELLQFHNINAGKIDGDFGPITEGAVTTFQQSRGLKVDGVVGKETWEALIP